MTNPKLPPILINRQVPFITFTRIKTFGIENSSGAKEVNPKRLGQSLAAKRTEKFVLMRLSFRNILNFGTIRLREKEKIMSLRRSPKKASLLNRLAT